MARFKQSDHMPYWLASRRVKSSRGTSTFVHFASSCKITAFSCFGDAESGASLGKISTCAGILLESLTNKMKKECRDPGLNRGPSDLQSDALPTELSRLSTYAIGLVVRLLDLEKSLDVKLKIIRTFVGSSIGRSAGRCSFGHPWLRKKLTTF